MRVEDRDGVGRKTLYRCASSWCVIVAMGAALDQKRRTGERGEKERRARKGERKTVSLSIPRSVEERVLRERERLLAKSRRRGGFSANVRLLATVRWRPPLSGQNHAFLPHFFRISISQSVASTSLPTANAGDEASMLPRCGRFCCFSLWRNRRQLNSRLDDSYCFIIKFAAHRVFKCRFKR